MAMARLVPYPIEPTSPPAVETRGLVKVYRGSGSPAVKGVDLEVPIRGRLAVLGPNGAGKSTLMGMLVTMLRPTAGEALVMGCPVATCPGGVRRRIGVVFQERTLDARLTALENLELHCRLYGMPGPMARERAEEALELVGLQARRDSLVETLSGGMQRRLELARAMSHRPDVLLLDEPTAGLDASTRAKIWSSLARMNQDLGTTLVLSTHDMVEAQTLCDRVAIMARGEILVQQDLSSLLGGGAEVVIRVRCEPLPGPDDLAMLTALPGVREARLGGGGVRILAEGLGHRVPDILGLLGTRGLAVTELEVRPPSLEDLSLRVVGHGISPNGDPVEPDDEPVQSVRASAPGAAQPGPTAGQEPRGSESHGMGHGSRLATASEPTRDQFPVAAPKALDLAVVAVMWTRMVRRTLRARSRLLGGLLMPLFFLFFMGHGFTGVGFAHGSQGGYLGFLTPGILAMSLLFSSTYVGLSVVWDRKFGFLREILVSPVSRLSMVVGRMAGGVTLSVGQAGLIFLGALALGAPAPSASGALIALSAAIAVSGTFIALGLAAASWLEDPQGFSAVMNFVIFPMYFASGAMYPVSRLPAAVRYLAYFDPLYYGVDAMRAALARTMELPVAVDLAALASAWLMATWVAVWAFSRMEAR